MGFWMTLLVYAATTVIWELIRPKVDIENAKPAGLGDFNFPTATEQRHVPLWWGTLRTKGPNVVWYGDLRQDAIVEEVKTGLWRSQDVIRGYRYSVGVQFALCLGEVDELTRVWVGDDLVYDGTPGGPDTPVTDGGTFTIDEPTLFGGDEFGNGGVSGAFRFFAGSSTQSPSTYLSAFQQEGGDTPGYRDVCYIAPDVDPTYIGNSTSVEAWSFELLRAPNQLGMTGGLHIVNGADANIACVAYEVLTNADWGFGFGSGDIDAANFIAAGTTLHAEGNGFSMQLSAPEDREAMIRRLEQQADAIVYQDQLDGLWKIKLVRDDYDILLVPEINATNLLDLPSFNRGTWEGTVNQVQVPIAQRDDEYKETYGYAQDMANARITGRNVTSTVNHPGVKDAALANSLAWRELKTVSIPLATAEFIVDRSLYGVQPGDVVGFTDADLDYDRLPMRVRSVNYGNLLRGEIRIEATQDVFKAAAGSFSDPPPSGWVPPSSTLVDYAADELVAFEAPLALTKRDPAPSAPAFTDKLYAAARRTGSEVAFRITERNAAGSPAGSFEVAGTVYGFQFIGSLAANLGIGGVSPVASLDIVPGPDTQSAINEAFPDATDVVELGTELLSLFMVNDEFFLAESSQTSASNVQLNNVYRGILDSVRGAHSAGDDVFMIFVGAGLSSGTVPAGNNVEVKLVPTAADAELDGTGAVTTSFAMDNRTRRPYPVASFDINGVTLDETDVSLEFTGAGEDVGVLIDEVIRRDYRATDEIASTLTDAATLDPSFPAANSTVGLSGVFNGPILLFSEDEGAGTGGTIRKYDILHALDQTSLAATLGFATKQRHVHDGVTYDSRDWLLVESTIDDPLVGKHAWGAVPSSTATNTYTVQAGQDGTDHDLTMSTAMTGPGRIEYRINGGGWVTGIANGATSGSIPNASLTAGDTIELQSVNSDSSYQKLVEMSVGGTVEAYAIMSDLPAPTAV